jgi:hypothetical protein
MGTVYSGSVAGHFNGTRAPLLLLLQLARAGSSTFIFRVPVSYSKKGYWRFSQFHLTARLPYLCLSTAMYSKQQPYAG